MYGKEYKDDFQKQFNNMKQNITEVREILCALFFYTEGGYKSGESLENAITLVQNAYLIAMPHFDEIYLALSRTSNRYDDEYECIKGNDQTIYLSEGKDLSLIFSFDHYLFTEKGKLYIDGKEVPKGNYTISKGSTVITIKRSYLNTLQAGKHTIVAKIDDKEAEASFTISEKKNTNNSATNGDKKKGSSTNSNNSDKIKLLKNNTENNPQTGDNIMLYISLFTISVIGLFGVIIINKGLKRE